MQLFSNELPLHRKINSVIENRTQTDTLDAV